MEKIMYCHHNGKDGFKYGENGYCHTYNKNIKSRRRAYIRATKDAVKSEHAKDK